MRLLSTPVFPGAAPSTALLSRRTESHPANSGNRFRGAKATLIGRELISPKGEIPESIVVCHVYRHVPKKSTANSSFSRQDAVITTRLGCEGEGVFKQLVIIVHNPVALPSRHARSNVTSSEINLHDLFCGFEAIRHPVF